MVTGEPMGGGNNALEVIRVGDTVRRARDAGSDFAARCCRTWKAPGTRTRRAFSASMTATGTS